MAKHMTLDRIEPGTTTRHERDAPVKNGNKTDRPLRLLIFEPKASGHRMVLYLRSIVKEAVRRRWILHIVTTASALDHPAYSLLCEEYGDQFTVSTMPAVDFPAAAPSIRNLLRTQFQEFRAFTRAYQKLRDEVQPDVIYVNGFSSFDKIMGALGSPFKGTPLVGMLLGVKFHHRSMGVAGSNSRNDWFYQQLFARLLRTSGLKSILVTDPALVPYMEQSSPKGFHKVKYVPEVAHLTGTVTREAARRALGINDHQTVILVYGALSERKGIRSLLDTLRDLGPASNVVVLLVGAQDVSTRKLLAEEEIVALNEARMLIVIEGFVDDEREFAVFKSADIVWLGYQGFYGMSGVLLQAGLAALPVIACKQGMIGWLVQRHGLGELVDTLDRAQIASSIQRLASDPQMRRSYGEQGRSLAMTHTPRRLAEGVCDAISGVDNNKAII